MIEKIVTLQGIGLLHEAIPSGALELKRLTTVYAENERGKSTLAAIFRSLSSGDTSLIKARKTIGGTQEPEVHFRINNQSYKFREHQWDKSFPNIIVFDDQFVETNVYIGSRVEPVHRENLLEFALGEEGVRLKKDLDKLADDIDSINRRVREIEKIIEQFSRPFNVREFVSLQPDHDVDARLGQIQRRISDAHNIESLKNRPVPVIIVLPTFKFEDLQMLLQSSLENISEQAEQKVREHIQHNLDPQGENWIQQGMNYLAKIDDCPFCGRGGVHEVELIRAYKAYFDASYNKLKQIIEAELKKFSEVFGDRCWGEVRERIKLNKACQQAWGDRSNISFPPNINEEDVKLALDEVKEAGIEALKLKHSAPLSKVGVPESLSTAYQKYNQLLSKVDSYNMAIEKAKSDIFALTRSLETERLVDLENQLKNLEAEKRRLAPEISQLCIEYQTLQTKKRRIEEMKEAKRQELNRYTESVLRRYKENINSLLKKFGAGFSIEKIDVTHVRGTPRSEYVLRVLGQLVPVTSDAGESPGTSFATVMSSGGKRTLALALFLGKLNVDNDLASNVIVVDDPVSSLDAGRRRETRNALAELTQKCSQVIVLSHDAIFLKDLSSLIRDEDHASLQIRRQRDFSIMEKCDINRLCRDEYYRVYESLVQYLEQGQTGNESDVAGNIREYLEHNLWTRFPIELEGTRNLGEIISRMRQDPQRYGGPANRIHDLERLNEFSSRYHHLVSTRRPPPTDQELRSMVELALEIGRG